MDRIDWTCHRPQAAARRRSRGPDGGDGLRGRGNGTEVYFLSQRGASDQADADLSSLENAADLAGGVPPEAEDDVVSILYDGKRASAMQQSQPLAESLLEHISADRRLESRGVKQAGSWY